MNAEMAWMIEQLHGQCRNIGRRLVGVCVGVPQRLCCITNRGTLPISDDVGHLGRMHAVVTLVHVLDDLFATTTFDVDVDVGWPVTFR